LENISTYLKTHWDGTKNLWDDGVRDQVDKEFIQEFRDIIYLCLKGNCGKTYVYGRGMFDFFQFIEKSACRLSELSEKPTTFDSSGVHALSVRYTDENKHKKKYSDAEEVQMEVDYDEYPDH